MTKKDKSDPTTKNNLSCHFNHLGQFGYFNHLCKFGYFGHFSHFCDFDQIYDI